MTWLIIVAVGVATLDWFAVKRELSSVEQMAKPMVMVVLLAAVLSADLSTASALVAAGLVCSLLGDVLLLAHIDRFLAGLAAFFVGHIAFIGAFVSTGSTPNPVAIGLAVVIAALLVHLVGREIVRGASREPQLRAPVIAYIAVLGTMLVASGWTASFVAGLGALLFAVSDAVLGWNRFVRPLRDGRLWTHIPYHLGQALIALWSIAAVNG